MEHGGPRGPEDLPTPEEFGGARRRELARLNVRLSSTTGRTHHTPEDEGLLEGDSADRRWADMANARRWSASKSVGRPAPPGWARSFGAAKTVTVLLLQLNTAMCVWHILCPSPYGSQPIAR